MNENIKQLMEKIQADKELRAKFDKVESPEEAYKLAASVQDGFTQEECFAELKNFREEQGISEDDIVRVSDVADEDLDKVAGGMSAEDYALKMLEA